MNTWNFVFVERRVATNSLKQHRKRGCFKTYSSSVNLMPFLHLLETVDFIWPHLRMQGTFGFGGWLESALQLGQNEVRSLSHRKQAAQGFVTRPRPLPLQRLGSPKYKCCVKIYPNKSHRRFDNTLNQANLAKTFAGVIQCGKLRACVCTAFSILLASLFLKLFPMTKKHVCTAPSILFQSAVTFLCSQSKHF